MAHREMRVVVDWRRKAVVVLAAISVLTLLGPFGTFTELTPGRRLAYWSTAILSIGVLMNVLFLLALNSPRLRRVPPALRIVAGASVGAVPGGLMVVGIERIFKGPLTGDINFLWLVLCVWSIGVVIGMFDLFTFAIMNPRAPESVPLPLLQAEPAPEDQSALSAAPTEPAEAEAEAMPAPQQAEPPPAEPAPARRNGPCKAPAFFARLPPEVGHDLICLTMQDHYLNVRTAKGSCMILHRITDAEKELQDYPGLRVHRSHWVALGHVTRVVRRGSAHFADLDDGGSLPVSRTYVARLRSALAGTENPTRKGRDTIGMGRAGA